MTSPHFAHRWSQDEDDLLRQLIGQYGRQWSMIASHIPNRTPTQVAARWEKCINPTVTKGQFTAEEDALITSFVAEHGTRAWPKLVSLLPHRTTKQCRERWLNSLDPAVTKEPWTPEEDQLIFEGYVKHGPKWAVIMHGIPGRSDNAVKNRWNASISKRVHTTDGGGLELGPSKTRKYSKRKAARPPPIVPPETPSRLELLSKDLDLTPRFLDFDALGEGAYEHEFMEMDSLQLGTPLASPVIAKRFSVFSPTRYECEF
jgi:hypothetical protein